MSAEVAASPAAPLLHTPLHALHLELGARMVPFAGYAMPVQYPAGILAEHRQCRHEAALFDVSHMGQLMLKGPDAAAALETLVPVDVIDLPLNKQRYALFTNAQGGLLDDLMITHREDGLFVIVNAACKDADLAHLREHIGNRCEIVTMFDRALLALQGPMAVHAIARLSPGIEKLTFMTGGFFDVAGVSCYVTRSGYTGEDGFEISVSAADADKLARTLLEQPEVKPVGLGARDSLRLEAGLCLYGHDIDTTTTPVEASLTLGDPEGAPPGRRARRRLPRRGRHRQAADRRRADQARGPRRPGARAGARRHRHRRPRRPQAGRRHQRHAGAHRQPAGGDGLPAGRSRDRRTRGLR